MHSVDLNMSHPVNGVVCISLLGGVNLLITSPDWLDFWHSFVSQNGPKLAYVTLCKS